MMQTMIPLQGQLDLSSDTEQTLFKADHFDDFSNQCTKETESPVFSEAFKSFLKCLGVSMHDPVASEIAANCTNSFTQFGTNSEVQKETLNLLAYQSGVKIGLNNENDLNMQNNVKQSFAPERSFRAGSFS